MFQAITVCVNYADYFQHIVGNRSEFDSWLIVTHEDDKDTINLCNKHSLDYCFSERVSLDGGFHKGKAINDGILQMNPQDWVVLVDADTLLVYNSFRKVQYLIDDPDCFYAASGRLQCDTRADLHDVLTGGSLSNLEHVGLMAGFLQVWHSSARPFYAEESSHAGLDDILFRDSYQRNHWRQLPMYGIHLGPAWLNHKGRVTPQFE